MHAVHDFDALGFQISHLKGDDGYLGIVPGNGVGCYCVG